MHVIVAAVGKLGTGPERALVEHYLARAQGVARRVGVADVHMREIAESRARSAAERRNDEAASLLEASRRLGPGVAQVALDASGAGWTSEALAARIGAWRDGARPVAFLIGGPDGHGEEAKAAAEAKLAFGACTWPHLLVRAMLCEQIYRAFSILAAHPYHRS
jgi:23S rRNA (pseudouridine1915-N3)-methyltransferase